MEGCVNRLSGVVISPWAKFRPSLISAVLQLWHLIQVSAFLREIGVRMAVFVRARNFHMYFLRKNWVAKSISIVLYE